MNLFRTLEPREIECRVQSQKDNGLICLLYKDARCDMNILDETVGPMNWKRSHMRDNQNCVVSIWDADKREWISKEDTGTESNTEAEKGLASDSFKRACFNWGIGRELYTSPFIWINAENYELDSKKKCKNTFAVSEIGYNEFREINKLVIINEQTRKVAYAYGAGRKKSDTPNEESKKEEPKKESNQPLMCELCGSQIISVPSRENKEIYIPAADIAAISRKRFGKCLCANCQKAASAKKEK